MTTLHGPASALSPVERYLHALYDKHRATTSGQVARYIPELARADPQAFGICIATRDGHVYEVGDTQAPFTIQSISKALVYGLALQDQGEAHVLSRIGVEPSGDAFNAISLRPATGTPVNPMINAGAIATTGQVLARDGLGRLDRILAHLSACAGRPLDIDEAVYRSESASGHRNRAIGWMLRNFDVIEADPTDVLEAYFQQCAVRVTCRDLALMGATLANRGVNPLTGVQAVERGYVDNILSVMATCGMYDYSGEWIYRVGLPAKSGVGGGVLAVLPGQLGIGIYSPPLDAQGNSVRGVAVCTDLARDLGLHLFQDGAHPLPALRLAYDAARVHSRRRRSTAERTALARDGHRARVLELQGDLVFGSLEPVLRRVHEQATGQLAFVFDLRNVTSADRPSLALLVELQQTLQQRGVLLLVACPDRLESGLLIQGLEPGTVRASIDHALETVEDLLLAESGIARAPEAGVALADCELLAGLSSADLDWLQTHTEPLAVAPGPLVVRAGEPGDALFFVLAGRVEVRLPSTASHDTSRIDVFSAGLSFGEMAFMDGAPRSADVVAITPVQCRVLKAAAFAALDRTNPALKIRLLERITRQLSANLRRINEEVLAFRG